MFSELCNYPIFIELLERSIYRSSFCLFILWRLDDNALSLSDLYQKQMFYTEIKKKKLYKQIVTNPNIRSSISCRDVYWKLFSENNVGIKTIRNSAKITISYSNRRTYLKCNKNYYIEYSKIFVVDRIHFKDKNINPRVTLTLDKRFPARKLTIIYG